MNAKNAHNLRGYQARPGSALLIVIGTLALIAVFAAIYITIGQGDRRAAATVRQRNNAQEIESAIAGHIAGVIARDRLDVFTQHLDASGTSVAHYREITDAPFTDWTVRSESNNEYELFNPTGRHVDDSLRARLDYRVPYDPWLAATRPTYLGSDVGRQFSALTGDPATDRLKEFLDHRDWLQISNLADDGRFVNLFNLRPQQEFGARGGFDAEPGVGITNFNGRNVRRMSEGLSLLKPLSLGNPESPIQAHVDGFWLPGQDVPVGTLDPNIPAHWTMYQRYMLLPLDQPSLLYDRNGTLADWSSPDYAPYQYADADGDGFADSRWFELVSARETHGTSATPRTDIKRLYDNSEYRVFAAARVVDLSSMVNVNVATDGLLPPTSEHPFGMTPADVDLRRLLTMQDAARQYARQVTAAGATVPLNYSGLHRPTIYRGTGTNPFERSEADYVQYQQAYNNGTASAPFTASSLELNPDSHAALIGRYAYDALRMGINREFALTNDYFGRDYFADGSTPQLLEDLVQYPRDPLFNAYPSKPDMVSMDTRVDQYEKIARIDPSRIGYGGFEEYGAGLYGIDDLAELLTYHSINDPAVTTRLEAVLSGRLENADNKQQDRLSPLLSNRPLELDRYRHGQVKDGAAGSNANRPRVVNGTIAEESMTLRALSPRGLMTTISGAVGLRPSTIVSVLAGRPGKLDVNEAQSGLRGVSDATSRFGLYSRALAGEIGSFNATTGSGPGAVGADIWVSDLSRRRLDSRAAPYATLFYGHRGPEFAYRVAAHAAVNMVDMQDGNDSPTIATFMIAADPTATRDRVEDLIEALDDDTIDFTSMNADTMEAMRFPGVVERNVLEVPAANVPSTLDTDANMAQRRLVNVIGVEPMPVISEVASMYVYTDAPQGAGGDADYLIPRPGPDPLTTDPVTIRGGIDPTNEDFLLQVLAIQLTNPFDETINLGGVGNSGLMGRKGNIPSGFGGNTNNFEFLYYIEYNGRFFKLGEFVEFNPSIADGGVDYSTDGGPPPSTQIDPTIGRYEEFAYRDVVLLPGESRVFFALAHERFDSGLVETAPGSSNFITGPDEHWYDIMNSYGTVPANQMPGQPGPDGKLWTGMAQEWLLNQFRNNEGGTAVHMHQFNPTTGALEEVNQFTDLFTPPASVAGVTRPASETANQVRLWRKHVVPELEEAFEQSLPTNATRQNYIENDILVDRFFLEGSLENALPVGTSAGGNEIDDTVSFDEGVSGFGSVNRNDNTGLSIVRWKTERRKDSIGDDKHPYGQVGPWAIQSRQNPANTRIRDVDSANLANWDSPDANTFFTVNGTGSIGRPTTLVDPKDDLEVHPSLFELYRLRSGTYTNKVIQTIAVHPGLKSEVGNDEPGVDPGNQTSLKFSNQRLTGQIAGDELYVGDGPKPEIFNKQLWSAKRVADLLLTTGIGITYAPDPTRPVDQTVIDGEWITFPEAMAIALGYEQPVATDFASADSLWWDAVLASGPGGLKEYALDDLHLSIDNYVAYIDGNRDQQYTPNGNDIPRGTGAPIALGVIDMVRPIDWLEQLGDQALSTEEQALLPLKRASLGKINVNTAPVEVLRLLPGLSPSLESYRDDATLVQEWWANASGFSGTNLADLSNFDETPDVAAGIVAYRDRMIANARIESYDPSTATIPFGFQPTNVQSAMVDRNMIDEALGTNDRVTLTGINGLRGSPGFGSLGEVLAVTLDESSPFVSGASQLTMGHYALDNEVLGTAGVDTDNDGSDDDYASLDLQVFGTQSNPQEGGIEDDYAENLAIANGVLNTLSVRSDYYAVWFVVQGFRESDVANLGENDPLVPSFKKRYLMVVDRSNVIKEGQQPRILMLKEVPL